MRVLIANMNQEINEQVIQRLESIEDAWVITAVVDGLSALHHLQSEPFDLFMLHVCLPHMDGVELLNYLWKHCPIAPPRILFLCQAEIAVHMKPKVDCVSHLLTTPSQLCALLQTLQKKPLPKMEAVHHDLVQARTIDLLDALRLRKSLKGYAYACWLLCHLTCAPLFRQQPISTLYQLCAHAFCTNANAVERCLRVAIESIFTQGSLEHIDHVFGATVDPERGKPTNRAFLWQASEQLSHSLTDTRSLNNSVMHHKPAAPTSV